MFFFSTNQEIQDHGECSSSYEKILFKLESIQSSSKTKFTTTITPSSLLDDILISGQSNDGLAGKLDSLAFYR